MAYNNQNQDPHTLSDDELYQIADKAWRADSADYSTAYQYASILAERNHAGGLTILGIMFNQGRGIQQDRKKGQYYFTRAALLGHPAAQFFLAEIYDSDSDPRIVNLPLAVYWYEHAANQRIQKACYNLGQLYKYDDRVQHNEEIAFDWFKKGAELNYTDCVYELGRCYLMGEGTEKDQYKGAQFITQAAESGNEAAQYILAGLYQNGVGVSQDVETAFYWYKTAANNQMGAAMYQLGVMYENGNGVRANKDEALIWYKKAEENGYGKASEGIKRLQGGQGKKTPVGLKNSISSKQYQNKQTPDELFIDLALCVDLTPVMPGLTSTIKRQIKELPNRIEEECRKKGLGSPHIRARLVVYKDCRRDDDALRITDFYTLPDEKKSFEAVVDSMEANGASVYRSGLEALMYAMCSQWTENKPNRQVVIIWAKGDTRQIGIGYEASKNMPKSFYQLSRYWGKNGESSSIMDADAKRLVMLVPSEPEWNKLSSSWENSFHIPCRAGEGIQTNSRKFDEIASFIVR